MMNKKNTYGAEFADVKVEEIVLATALAEGENADLLRRKRIVTQGKYALFSRPLMEDLAEGILQFYHLYNTPPQPEALVTVMNGQSRDPALRTTLDRLFKITPQPDTYVALLDRLAQLAIMRATSDNLIQCALKMEQGEIDGIEILHHQLTNILQTRSLGTSVVEGSDWKERGWADDYLHYREHLNDYQISLDLGKIGTTLGGASYGQMMSLYGHVNHGKSFLLGHLAWDFFRRQGLHVVHVTLETAKRFVDWRYAARAIHEITEGTGPGFNDFLQGRVVPRQLKWAAALMDSLDTPGSLYVLDIPEEFATVDFLTALIQEHRRDYPTDVVIIDYAALMRLSHNTGQNPLEWDVQALLSKELRDGLARSRTLTNSTGEKGVFLLTANQTKPDTTKKSVDRFAKTIQASDVGISYLISQPVDFGIHLRREKDIGYWEQEEKGEKPPDDLLMLVLSKSRYTGGIGTKCWFRPNWENWVLGPMLNGDEVMDSLGLGGEE